LEEIILPNLFKTQGGKTPLKSPVIPVEQPVPPTEKEKREGKLPDDNVWVWDIREGLKELFHGAIQPLYEYLDSYQRFDDVLALNPEAYIAELEEEDPPREFNQLRDEIYNHMEKEK